jgi:hypothetical protein
MITAYLAIRKTFQVLAACSAMMPAKEEATKQPGSANAPLKSMSTEEIAKACAAMMAELEKRKGGR